MGVAFSQDTTLPTAGTQKLVRLFVLLLQPCDNCVVCILSESWVHCNDARLSRATSREVHSSQAYILFYTRLKETDLETDLEEGNLDEPPTKKKRT